MEDNKQQQNNQQPAQSTTKPTFDSVTNPIVADTIKPPPRIPDKDSKNERR